jgi:CheY-like chemotaxis protein
VKIVLVDDDPIVVLLQKKLMEKAGISSDIISFSGGSGALDYIADKKTDEKILLFLDINMPGLSGWEVLDEMERLNMPFDFEVIIITSSVDVSDRIKADTYEKIVDFWIKPFSLEDFIALKSKFNI